MGQAFYHRSRTALQDLDEAEAEVSRLQSQPRGVLRLNVPMSFGILHIAPLLAEFHALHPDVRIDLNLDDRKLDVIEEGFDLSLRISELPDSSLVARRLCRCRHAVVAAPGYLDAMGAPKTPAELDSHRIVTFRYQESRLDWHFLNARKASEHVSLNGHTRINNSLAIRAAVLAGLGIARMPTFIVGEDIKAGRLHTLFDDYQVLELSIFLIYPQRRHISPKVRAFIDFMTPRFKDPPAWD